MAPSARRLPVEFRFGLLRGAGRGVSRVRLSPAPCRLDVGQIGLLCSATTVHPRGWRGLKMLPPRTGDGVRPVNAASKQADYVSQWGAAQIPAEPAPSWIGRSSAIPAVAAPLRAPVTPRRHPLANPRSGSGRILGPALVHGDSGAGTSA